MRKLLRQLLFMNLALLLAAVLVIPAVAKEVQEVKYTLTLHKNDGSSVALQETRESGDGFSLAEYLFERDSHVQVAWLTEDDEQIRLNALYVPATSTDLYAFWLEIKDSELDSGVVVLNSLENDLDGSGTFFKKKMGSMILPETLHDEELLAWSTQVQPKANKQGVFSGQWYAGGQVVTPEDYEIVSLFGQHVRDGAYMIYDPNGRTIANGGTVVVQKAQPTKQEGVMQATVIGEEFFEVADNDALIGWSTEEDAIFPDYFVGDDVFISDGQTQVLYAIWHHLPVFSHYVSNNDATCLEDGTMTAVCDDGCGEEDTIIDEGSALGHKYLVYTSNHDATCLEDGTMIAICENGCGIDDIALDIGSALGHDMGDWEQVATPDCTLSGEEMQTCTRCEYYALRDVPALGHTDINADNICDVCKEELCKNHVYEGAVPTFEWSVEGCTAAEACTVCSCGYRRTPITFSLRNDSLTMDYVPTDVLLLIASYEDGQLCDVQTELAAKEISITVQGDELRVFFVDKINYRPLMLCLRPKEQRTIPDSLCG